jgi:hypothetical protein
MLTGFGLDSEIRSCNPIHFRYIVSYLDQSRAGIRVPQVQCSGNVATFSLVDAGNQWFGGPDYDSDSRILRLMNNSEWLIHQPALNAKSRLHMPATFSVAAITPTEMSEV